MKYKVVYECCLRKVEELGITFDFDNNTHIQTPENMNDIYKNFVYHSQNRSQGYAVNFFKEENEGDIEFANEVWGCIENYTFDFDDDYSYIGLFREFTRIEKVNSQLSLAKGKDIQFLELAKTCQCIKKYLNRYDTLESFIDEHKFSEDAKNNWKILTRVSSAIYNVSTQLVPDFFKEQDCIKGREYLIKADIHVKRFISVLFQEEQGKQDLSDSKVYTHIINMYRDCSDEDKKDIPPYKLDKLIYLIGEHFGNPQKSKAFAKECRHLAE
jgi:hypothetical protein